MSKVFLLGAWLLHSIVLAHSAAFLQDSFIYTNGSLVSVSAGAWTTHSGVTGEVAVVSGRTFLSQNNSEDVSTTLPGQPYTAASGAVLYASFNISFARLPAGSGGYFAHFKGGTTFRGRIFATTNGAATGSFRIGVANGDNAPSAVLETNLNLNAAYKVVLRYALSNATATLWLNPASENADGIPASDVVSTINMTSFALRQSLSSGSGMGELWVDDLLVGTQFTDVISNSSSANPPLLTTQPQNQSVNEGAAASFTVEVTGSPPLQYQWQFNGTNLAAATNATLTITNVSLGQTGAYLIVVSNSVGSITSQAANLTISPAPTLGSFTLLTYNVEGNGATNWSTKSLQIQAIGRQVVYLNPDIITFNEIPYAYTYEMTNFVNAYLPGYALAMNSGTDGYIRSVVASRFPIMRSQKWLDGVSLIPYGDTNHFARDLFEAEISVPRFSEPLHVFVTHLKAYGDSASAAQRAAEASAISNFFVNGFLTTNGNRPYVLTGDLNEDINRPPSSSQQPLQRLVNFATGLHLTTPLNPTNHDDRTISIQSGLSARFDYILPCGLLFTNIQGSEVFRTDLLNPTPPGLLKFDDKTASDHLPVLMTFNNPYEVPFRITSLSLSNQLLTLRWVTSTGRVYRVESSLDLKTWTAFPTNQTATGTNLTLQTSPGGSRQFYRVSRLP